MMTATPIPRTLAMSYYADLDVSTIDELPPGRTPIVTKVVSDQRRAEAQDGLQKARPEGDPGRAKSRAASQPAQPPFPRSLSKGSPSLAPSWISMPAAAPPQTGAAHR